MEVEQTSGLSRMSPEAATKALLATIISITSAASGEAGPLFYTIQGSNELTSHQVNQLSEIVSFVWSQLNPDIAINADNVSNIVSSFNKKEVKQEIEDIQL